MPKTVGSGARTAALIALIALGTSGSVIAQEDAPSQDSGHSAHGAGAETQSHGSAESGHGTGEGHGMMDGSGMMSGSRMMDGHGMTEAQGETGSHGHESDIGDGSGAGASEARGSQATEAYRAANMAMHSAMDIEFSGDADIDFARGMIGHHQGAIDMARIVLEHGEDPDLRQLAQEIIATQESEIAFLRDWIAEHAPE